MAELNAELKAEPTAPRPHPPAETPVLAPPHAADQLRAIAWLRWRILANGFRRKGGAGELIARIVVLPLFAVFALLPTAAAGILSFEATRRGHLFYLSWILWGAFGLTQILNINLGQPGTNFDPVELIRFPMPLGRWVLVRLCFGLLGPANLVVSLVAAAVVVGVTLAAPHLFPAALIAMTVFGLTNILFTRMVFAWIDRWLSTRRAREVFTGFIFLLSISFQILNARFNPGFQHRHHGALPARLGFLQTSAHGIAHWIPWLAWLPPGLTASSLEGAAHGNLPLFAADTALCSAFAAAFLGVYILRMRTEFRGENLSEAAVLTAPAINRPSGRSTPPLPVASVDLPRAAANTIGSAWLTPTLSPLLSKELLILRRNTGLFYGLVAPAVMVFLFAGRLSFRHGASHWVLLGAVAYALIGVAPLSFNSLGTEGTGAQLYFMAPVPIREIFFAKNVFNLLIALAETVLVTLITLFVAGRPSLTDLLYALLWVTGTLLLSMTVGNRRSLAAPRRVLPGRTLKKTQSPLSTYISLGIMLGCTGLGFGCQLLAVYLDKLWIGLVLMLAYTTTAMLVYDHSLGTLEAYAGEHRDTLFEELGRKT